MIPADLSWYTESYPELREGPPWVMEEMIAAETGLAEPIAAAAGADAIAAAVTRAASAGEPIVVTGCGTSEHGALAVAALLDDALRTTGTRAPSRGAAIARRRARSARRRRLHRHLARRHDAGDDPRARGGPRGGRSDRDDRRARRLADRRRMRSRDRDAAPRPLLVPHGRVYEHDPRRRRDRARDRRRRAARTAPPSARRSRCDRRSHGSPRACRAPARILAVGLGADLVTARELALKIEEGARIPSTALHLESLLHGHLAGCDADATALVLLAADASPARWRDQRLAGAAGAAAAIGIPTVAIGGEAALAGLPAASRASSCPPATSPARSSPAPSRCSC